MPFKLKPESRIVVTGAGGMVGRRLVSRLKQTQKNVIGLTRNELDLENREATKKVFSDLRPEAVFHIAGHVGGIQANIENPVQFLTANTLMAVHTLEAAHACGVQKLLFMGSSCIYPRDCQQPMREEYLLTGPLEPTNEGYALAKITGLKLAAYYHQQFGLDVVCPVPSNIYGPGDTFKLDRAHVLSSLVRRFVDAQELNSANFILWGTGVARREFIHVNDVVEGCLFLFENYHSPEIINLGPGTDISILELANLIAKKVGYSGKIEFDPSRPSGMPRKMMNVDRLRHIGFHTQVSLSDGIDEVINEYRQLKKKGALK